MHTHPQFFIVALFPLKYKSISKEGKTLTRSVKKDGIQRVEAGSHAFQGVSAKGRALILVLK